MSDQSTGRHGLNAERLWAPWRLGYIKGDDQAPPPPTPTRWLDGADRDCFVCRAAAEYGPPPGVGGEGGDLPLDADRANLVAARDEQCVVVLNRYPYSNGHLLVSPRRHVAELAAMTDAEHLACMRLLARLTRLLACKVHAQGFNVGLNLGQLAGAGVPGHLHWHLVPRWPGDHNFMPVLAGVRVIPQSLEELWELIAGELG